ncbi:hypothetical protein [Rugamonas rivuli]|uniref:Uncharacterized protein n=1 Tax=Rugamonas rivuli TaxID=2743358 RepID=A0A843SFH3_9BURK|nr:hypothetical protein [Rugamonas rivuli]MQA21912.1 hypothetical protein [Rugamonas rivuli]
MDPITLLVAALAKNPDTVASTAKTLTTPGTVDVVKMKTSLVDLSRGILACYHKTAKFRQTDVLTTPWERQGQYGADRSAVIKISFTGMTGASYEMLVAVMAKENSVRSAVIAENSVVPYNKRCVLEEWVSPG